MSNSFSLAQPGSFVDLQAVFNEMPGNFMVLQPNAPRFTILMISDELLHLTRLEREDVIGKSVFEVFPENEAAATATGPSNLRTSLENVISQKVVDHLPVLRYDVLNHDGIFEERYWRSMNKPVTGKTGEVDYIIHATIEVTDKIKNEKRKKEKEKAEHTYDLFMQAPVAVCIVRGPEYTIELANDGMLQFLGRTSEIIGKPIIEALPEARLQGLIGILDTIRKTGQPFYAPTFPAVLLINGARELRYFELVLKPYFVNGREKEVTTIFCVAHNVTEQVMARKKIEEAEERARLAVDSAELGTYEINLVTNEIVSSPRMAVIFDLDHASERENYISAIYPEDLTMRKEAYRQASETGVLDYEGRVKWKDGSMHWVKVKGKVFYNKEKEPERLFGVVQDITEQKLFSEALTQQVKERTLQLENTRKEIEASAARLAAVFNNSQSGMFTFAPVKNEKGEIIDFRFVITNASFAAYVGQTPEVLNGALGSTWFPGYLHNGVFDMYLNTYLTGETQRSDIHYHVDQHDLYLDLRSSKVGDEVLVTFTDYTALKKAEFQLQKYIDELKRSNQNLEEFAHAASHDLKEPIRKIHFFTERLKDQLSDRLNENEKFTFTRIENASQRMGALIDDLLLYSHVNLHPPEKENVDLNEKVSKVLEDLELDIQQKKAIIKVDKLPVVKGHRRQLQQLFQNLIGNALKYSKPGIPPEIFISATRVSGKEAGFGSEIEANKPFHLIEVTDNGIGFEQTESERIFQMFQRLHGNTEYRGTGVGLSIARKVAENHYGKIVAFGEPGKGASFKVLLPML
jgi:PAS domain S-box-containing protein